MYSVFHIYVIKKGKEKRRTTLSMESVLSDLMAIKLGYEPGTKEAHSAVRNWIQEKQDEQKTREAQTLIIKKQLILEIAQKKIVDKYLAE